MKRKSFLGRVAIIAMALTLATTSMMSGTLARYETVKETSASAIIAKWNPALQLNDQTWTTTIDLAATAKDNGAAVASMGDATSKMIGPGTKGELKVTVDVRNVEVPVLPNIKAKKNSDYTIPNHMIVYVTDSTGGKNYGGTMAATYVSAQGANRYEDPFGAKGYADIIGGTQPALLFKSLKQSGTTRQASYIVHWEWPLDYTNYSDALAEHSDTSDRTFEASSDYNGFDEPAGGGTANTNLKFGFDLEVSLQQAGSNVTVGGNVSAAN